MENSSSEHGSTTPPRLFSPQRPALPFRNPSRPSPTPLNGSSMDSSPERSPSSTSRLSSYSPNLYSPSSASQYLQSSSPSTGQSPSYPTPRSRPSSYMGPSPSSSSSSNNTYFPSSVTGGGGGQHSPALSTHSNQSSYSTGGTRLQAKSAIAERTTREDLKSLRDVFDMGPEDDQDSKSGLKSSTSPLNDKKKESKWSIKDLRLGPDESKSNEDSNHSTDDEQDFASSSTILNINPYPVVLPQISNLQSRQEKSRRELERENLRRRKRRPDTVEFNQTMWIWSKEGAAAAGKEHGMLSDNSPNALKKKPLTSKRESTQFPSISIIPQMIESPSPIYMGEGKSVFEIGPDSSNKDGYWRTALGVLKDDGYLRIFSDEKKVVIQSIHLPSTPRTDIQQVDFSLFGRPHCLVLHRHSSSPPTANNSSSNSNSNSSRPSSYSSFSNSKSVEEPVYLCFPSIVAMQTWKVKLLCFAKPEFLDSGLGLLDDNHSNPLRTSSRGGRISLDSYSDEDFSDDDDDVNEFDHEEGKENVEAKSEGRCRIFRSITVVINEGRGIGELGSEIIRAAPVSAIERERRSNSERSQSPSGNGGAWSSAENLPSTSSTNDSNSLSKSTSSSSMPNSRVHPRGASAGGSLRDRDRTESSGAGGGSGNSSVAGIDTFCEVILDGEVVGRTSIKRGTTSPYWNETFELGFLPPFLKPLTVSILEVNKNPTKPPTLLGSAIVRIPDLPRFETIEDWWCVKPVVYDSRGKASDTLGELSMSVTIKEEIVLPKIEYSGMLELLDDDPDAELAIELSQEFSQSLEEVTRILLRIYQAQNLLLPRILRLAEFEIDGDTKSSAILFRGNSILTKSVELYLRFVGKDFLEAAIGGVIRRLCEGKIEIEIDPVKMKTISKDKELVGNIKELKDWCGEVWKEIYNSRERCPNELRQIFAHIQQLVTRKYGDENPNMKSTSIGAFIFLRFFVPAILNPKLFNLVPVTPSLSSQRTLTLIAKTLQGLANFSSFGIKEVWMGCMNEFLKENQESYVDFIKHISTPIPTAPDQWTSNTSALYFATNRIKLGLNSSGKEGIPLLPHLIDLPRDLGVLATLVAKNYLEKSSNSSSSTTNHGATYSPSLNGDSNQSPSSTSLSRAASNSTQFNSNRSPRYQEFTFRSLEIYEETRRRGGGSFIPSGTINSNGNYMNNNNNGSIGKGSGGGTGNGRTSTSFNASGSASTSTSSSLSNNNNIPTRSRSNTTTSISSSTTFSLPPPLTPERERENISSHTASTRSSSMRLMESPPSSVGSRRSNRSFKVGRDLFPEFEEGFKEEEEE